MHIILVEDNDGDILLTKVALEDMKVPNRITVVKDGDMAIDYFESIEQTQSIPDLLLLDLNLPKKTGHEVLHYIKTNERYKRIPVIMLTSSLLSKDILSAYQNKADCYITKPIDINDLTDAILKIKAS